MVQSNIPREDSAAGREVEVSRTFSASADTLWEAWTNPERVVLWWGPRGFTTTNHEIDVRPGGVWAHTMHGPDGTDYPNSSVFREIVKPERIVYSHGGREGGPGAHFVATWTFEALGKQTRLTLRLVFDTSAERDLVAAKYGVIEGGKQTLARLAEFLPHIAANTPFNPKR